MNTEELIEKLSQETSGKATLRSPMYYGLCLIATLLLYAIGSFFFFDVRSDIAIQFGRFSYLLEIVLLIFLVLSSAFAAIFSMYPDAHQKPLIIKIPYAVFALLTTFIIVQVVAMPFDPRMVLLSDDHGIQCALCIAAVSFLPSILIFGLLRKGASVTPLFAGSFAVLAVAALGSLVLRLTEANDSLMHIALWHYVPILIFSVIGAILGKWLLRW